MTLCVSFAAIPRVNEFVANAASDGLLTQRDGNEGFGIVSELIPTYPAQEEGISYGVDENGASLAYCGKPPPGVANGRAFFGFVEDITFDVERGLFTTPISGQEVSRRQRLMLRSSTRSMVPRPRSF